MKNALHPRQQIEKAISTTLEELGFLELVDQLRLDRPAQSGHGELASAVALKLFPVLQQRGGTTLTSPRAVAEQIVSNLNTYLAQHHSDIVQRVAVAGPGFINFTLTDTALFSQAAALAASSHDRMLPDSTKDRVQSEKILIEYVSPNTNKPLHIGHVRNAALGVAMATIWERLGNTVARATIFNDRGLHIIKSMWGYLYLGAKQPMPLTESWPNVLNKWQSEQKNWQTPEGNPDVRLQKSDHFVGHWYQQADALEAEVGVANTWSEMLQSWEDQTDPHHAAIRELWHHLNQYFYAGFAQTAARLQVRFDQEHESYESAIYQQGKNIVLAGAEAGVFERLEDGAIRVNLEDRFALPNKILLRKDGTGIYMTFDIELARQRSEMGFDKLHWLVGADQNLYFQQLYAVCELLGFGNRDKYHHFSYGMVRLPEGKMSSRKGRVVYADQLLDFAVEKAEAIMSETHIAKDLSADERRNVAEAVGVGAVQWTMLSQEPESEMTFDIDKSVSFKGFAGPYVQYTAARCASVVRAASEITSIDYETFAHIAKPIDIVIEQSEKNILRNLFSYFDTVERAGQEMSPQLLTTYLHELAQSFNALYAELPIVAGLTASDERERAIAERRVVLTAATEAVMRDGLKLLGIRSPEKM